MVQPCEKKDSCSRRCVKDTQVTDTNITLAYLNCFCDQDCRVYRDCCWDYYSQCVREDGDVATPLQKEEKLWLTEEVNSPSYASDEAFECVVVDEFSKGSYWMITKCSEKWNNEYVRKRCSVKENSDFVANLPVLGENGYTYRNVFCAQCNHVAKYYYWAMNARCVRSIPPEVLQGNSEMLSYYLEHFCSIEYQQDMTFENTTIRFEGKFSDKIQQSLAWRKSLRSCEQDVIDSCPEDYKNHRISAICKLYQSIVIVEDADDPTKNIKFKNPICALCHGYPLRELEKPLQPKSEFNETNKTVLMRFRENTEITYNDGSSSSTSIPPEQICDISEIYDPFNGICRRVVCANGLVFENDHCVSDGLAANNNIEPVTPVEDEIIFMTVSVSISLPVTTNSDVVKTKNSSEITADVVDAFEDVFNSSANNITILQPATDKNENDGNSTYLRDVDGDGRINITISFVILEPDEYTEQDIMKVIEEIKSEVDFDKLLMELDSLYVVVLQSQYLQIPLNCSENEEKKVYNSSEYSFESFNDEQFLYVNSTDSYYTENEYQNFSEDIVPCTFYAPLNDTEYLILENGSLWLYQRERLIPEDKYISYQGTYAICLDGYTPPPVLDSTNEAGIVEHELAQVIISWITFGLAIFSLTSLLFTFVTYCIFSELRSIAGWNIMNLTVALFSALLAYLVGAQWTDHPDVCTAIAILLHYLYLSTFFWNNVLAFDVWLTFGQGIKKTLRRSILATKGNPIARGGIFVIVVKYMAYGWGTPLLIVGVCVAVEFGMPQIHFGYRYDPNVPMCWISNPTTNVLAFGVPLTTILLVNAILFTISIIAIRRVTQKQKRRRHSSTLSVVSNKDKPTALSPKGRKPSEQFPLDMDNVFTSTEEPKSVPAERPKLEKQQKHRISVGKKSYKMSMGIARINVLLYVKMSTVMGFIWAIGLAAAVAETDVLWYIFEISVPLQGVFILFAFICKRRILELYKALFKPKIKWEKKHSDVNINRQIKPGASKIQQFPQKSLATEFVQRTGFATGVDPVNDRKRSRMWSTSSCESYNSHDRCISSPAPFRSRISAITDSVDFGVINRAYLCSERSQSRSSSESTHDDQL
ncbi:unnamed protein product [Clavelina lepadiformis]|uniref:Uncharacterized protein n=1 Tax=Clavelina lepadiformis TaxID=159417 RepID=A0ABP0GFB9_CLALP